MARSMRRTTPIPTRSFPRSRIFSRDIPHRMPGGGVKTAGHALRRYPLSMTQSPPAATRPYSPGLEGVVAGQTSLGYVDGEQGRLLYRGYRIGDLVEHGTYAAVANLLWTGEWDSGHRLATSPLPDAVETVLRALPTNTKPMDALRTAVSAWGATQDLPWPPTADHARALTSFSPSALAAFARIREGKDPIEPAPGLGLAEGFLYQLKGERPDRGTARALDAYFIVGAEHGFNASTFTARGITSTPPHVGR